MTEYRCPKCELLRSESDFKEEWYCKTCEQNNSARELGIFRSTFENFCTEIFYLRYLDEPHIFSATIPSDYWERKKMVQAKKTRLEGMIKTFEKAKENEIEDSKRVREAGGSSDINSERIKELTITINHLREQQPKVLQLEQRYEQ